MKQKLIKECSLLEEEGSHIQHTHVSIVFGIRILVLVAESIVSHI